jgi:hypothetical protein
MKARLKLPMLGLTITAVILLSTTVLTATETRAGVAAVDITPPMGIPMAGYYHERGADGTLDPLYSKALVIERDGVRAAYVVLDTIGVTREITDQARSEIEKKTGIPGGHVMISATHAHTGPVLVDANSRSVSMGGQRQTAVEYTMGLPKRVAESVCLANERLQPARLSTAKGICENLAFNRRYYMRDGSVGWNPGKLNPDIVLPAGPSDPEVGLLYIEKPDATGPGQSIATYVNFAMHPDTTGGSKFSADWPGALSRVLAGYHGPHHLTLTANGACGNINHLDFFWKWPNGGPLEQNRIATLLGASVFQACKDLKPIAGGALRVKSDIVELALPEITPQQAEDAKKTVETIKDDSGANFMKLVRAYRAVDVAERMGKPYRVEVQAIALGKDAAWVSLPGEVFVELGLAIKKRSPFPRTFVVELANENIGYIPDRRSYAEGNYEPESARCAAGSGEKLAEVASRLLAELFKSE